MCVKFVTFCILINGKLRGLIKPSSGLRLGDPLSPYLFLLYTEGLSFLLSKATTENNLLGIQISQGAPTLAHLLFFDESILFCKPNIQENKQILSFLEIYERASS